MVKGLFVTGTDTGVGKTWLALGLLAALQEKGYITLGMKPVACGCDRTEAGLRNADAVGLQAQSSLPLPYEWVNPYALAEPVAPHIAAADLTIELSPILVAFRRLQAQADYVIVEGIGGWKVPLNGRETSADLARALGLPVIVVVGIRLGCLNHALLTCESIAHHGVRLAGWVANRIDPACARAEQTIEALRVRLDVPLLGVIPHLPVPDPAALAARLDLAPLLAD